MGENLSLFMDMLIVEFMVKHPKIDVGLEEIRAWSSTKFVVNV